MLQEAVNGALVGGLASPEVHEALDLCLACKGCLSDCPDRGRHGHLQGRGAPPDLPGPPRARPPITASAGCPAGRPPPPGRPAPTSCWPPRRWPPPPSVSAGSTPAVPSRGSPPRPSAPGGAAARRVGRPRPPPRVLLWPDTFTDHFSPAVARRRPRPGGRRVPGRPPDEPLCCGLTWISTGQLDTARRVLRRTVDWIATLGSGVPMVGLEPSCLAVLRHDALGLLGPDDPAAVAVARAAATLAEVLAAAPGGRRPTSPAWPWWPSPTATSTPCSAGRPTATCWRGPGRGHRRRRLRAGRQLRRRARPLRRLGRRGRDRPPPGRGPPARTRSSWPTGSPAGPSSTTWPAAGPSTWPSCSTRPGTDPSEPRASPAGRGAAGRGSSAPGPRGGGRGRGAWRSA